MLPKSKRLTTREFSRVFKKGKRIKTSAGLVIWQKWGKGQCSVVVQKKQYKKATERNIVRRMLYNQLKNAGMKNTNQGKCIWLFRDVPEKSLFFSTAQSIVQMLSEKPKKTSETERLSS